MIHVYEIPAQRSNGYCFGGPVPIVFGNVDWFYDPRDGVFGKKFENISQLDDVVRTEILRKRYYSPTKRYLVLLDDHSFTIEAQD